MTPDKTPKYFVPVIIISVAVIFVAVITLVWVTAKQDRSIPVVSETSLSPSSVTPAIAPAVSSVGEEEWRKENAAELENAKKAIEEANARYETAEAEKTALAAELSITKEELDKAKVDLQSKEPPKLDTFILKERYEEVGELVTVDYEYEYISKATNNGKALSIFGSGDLIFWDTKEFLYQIPGMMKLGVDISVIDNGLIIDDGNKTVTLTIPAAYVIANNPDEINVKRYDLQKGWLNSNPVTDQDLLDSFTAMETDLKQRVAENGMLKYAQELAGHQIKDLLQPIASVSGYTVLLRYY
jgi:hypothetical protein